MRWRKAKPILRRACSGALLLGALWALAGCAADRQARPEADASRPAVIQEVRVSSSTGETTIVEIVASKPAPYTSFLLADPPRLVLDVRGVPADGLARSTRVFDRNVTHIRVEPGPSQAMTTRVVADLAREVEHKIAQKDNTIAVMLVKAETASAQAPSPPPADTAAEKPAASSPTSEPRIFFDARKTGLNEVLGLDFTMVQQGKSRLAVTTDKKAAYDLRRKGEKGLVLTLDKVSVRPLLLRHLDSTHFEGAVDKVMSAYTDKDGRLALNITLREMVPYHVDQSEGRLTLEFGATRIKPPDMKIVPLKVSEAAKAVAAAPAPAAGPAAGPVAVPQPPPPAKEAKAAEKTAGGRKIPGTDKSRYTGQPMTMDFVNAEVTNILRLIGEVSDLNIIWTPDVKGTVSMRLKKVPWDQALELVLTNNDLAMRREGNVLWVTTRAHLTRIEADEKKKMDDEEAEKRKVREDALKAVEAEPLEIAYFPVDFAEAKKIQEHIVKSKRGKTSMDERTNTIIMEDTPSSIAKAREIVKRFDTPVKQIMIEARIVDASTGLARDLGVQWNNFERQWREREGIDWLDSTATTNVTENVTPLTLANDMVTGGSFSSNSPEGWAANMGLQLARLTNGALGALAIDVSLALAESENKAKVISAPKVIASNGEKALIKRGDTFYLPAAENVEPKEVTATLSLEVTPTVSFNNFVNMEIILKDEQQTGENSKTGKDLKTKLMVKSGDTIVIGGIYTEKSSEEVGGIPFLKEIPLLGWAFKAESKIKGKSELLIFLTPTVLPDPTRSL